ncbi:MAG: hypothetical protein ACPGUD_05565 [Parashewanella sp.]
MIKLTEIIIHGFLWLGVAISPTIFGVIMGVFIGFSNGMLETAVMVCATLGFGYGALWAEKVRRTIGLLNFWSRLIGARDQAQ